MRALRERGLTPGGINMYARSINSFLTWAHEEGLLSERLRIRLLPHPPRPLTTDLRRGDPADVLFHRLTESADVQRLEAENERYRQQVVVGGKRPLPFIPLLEKGAVIIRDPRPKKKG